MNPYIDDNFRFHRNRFFAFPPDWEKVTDDVVYQDGGKSFNELANDAPMVWQLSYFLTQSEAKVFDDHYNEFRLSRPFPFDTKDGFRYSEVYYKQFERSHDGHKSWRQQRIIELVHYPGDGIITDSAAPFIAFVNRGGTVFDPGILDLTVSAFDNVAVERILFYQGNTQIGELLNEPFSFEFDIENFVEGKYNFSAIALDAVGNQSLPAVLNINILRTPPNVSLSIQSQDENSVTFAATASSPVGRNISSVAFFEGFDFKVSDANAPYVYIFDKTTKPTGSYTVSAFAYDEAGKMSEASSLTISLVNNPHVPTNFTAYPTSKSSVKLQWNQAVSGAAAAGYEIRVNNTTIINAGNALLYNHTGLESGTQYGYEIRAVDTNGYSPWSPIKAVQTPFDYSGQTNFWVSENGDYYVNENDDKLIREE